ncbi:MAG: tetratricopeptide repeat protein [Isosphaeraceae bacterium]
MTCVPCAAVRAPGLLALLALVALAAPGCRQEQPETLSRLATQEWTARRYDQAEAALARLATLRKLTLPERLLRAQVARDQGRLDEAITFLGDPARDAAPAETAVLLATRGTLELARHRLRDAEAALERAAALDPQLAEAHRELIHLRGLQGRTRELEAPFRALAATPSSGLSFSDLYLWTLGRFENIGPPELADTLRLALNADPADIPSRLALADNLRRLGRLDEAGQVVASADDPAATAFAARLALDQGDPDRALTLLGPERASPSEPADFSQARLRGRIALIRGDAGTALRNLRSAVARQPDDREALRAYSQALHLAGTAEESRTVDERLRRLDRLEGLVQNARPSTERDRPETLVAIAEACLAVDRTELGKAWLRLALARNPLAADIQKRLHQLDTPRP